MPSFGGRSRRAPRCCCCWRMSSMPSIEIESWRMPSHGCSSTRTTTTPSYWKLSASIWPPSWWPASLVVAGGGGSQASSMRRPAASSMGYPFPWRPWPVLRARTPLRRSLSLSLSARSFGDPSCGDPNSKLFWMRPYREVSEEKKKKKQNRLQKGADRPQKTVTRGGSRRG